MATIPAYEQRMETFGLATAEQVKEALSLGGTAILDVRTPDEIASTGTFQYNDKKVICVACMPDSAEELVQKAPELLPGKETAVVLYCKSGRRASNAKAALEGLGYKQILNAGGYDDIKSMDL